ncbi:hypothetical protein [Rhizobium sp. C4]|uniref:hypothetical protein n=1 Tax=Rhizobium sp. C4 TaxID=1349800 RepID=UPI001E4D24E9|nr:hypothetical protein [Rhizobium sp. C4]MCD2171580.1 hypothetical protein [Rhizobium sp. C4]
MIPGIALRLSLFVMALHLGALTGAAAGQDVVADVSRGVSAAIGRCFQAPKGYAPPYPAVALLLNFRPDGNLDGPPQLGDPPGGDARHSATVAAVLAAASECAKIDNAARFRQDYPAWKSLRLVFRPGEP